MIEIQFEYNPLKRFVSIFCMVLSAAMGSVSAQSNEILHFDWGLNANENPLKTGFLGGDFELIAGRLMPVLHLKIEGAFVITNALVNESDEVEITKYADVSFDGLNDRVLTESSLSFENGKTFTLIECYPYYLNSQQKLILVSQLNLQLQERSTTPKVKKSFKLNATESVLSKGTWNKISVKNSGIYKIDFNFLKTAGVEPGSFDFNTFKLYGNGGELLPEIISVPRYDDLIENSIFVQDNNNNNRWDDGDYVLFYAEGPHAWEYDASKSDYYQVNHLYSDESFYFFTFGGVAGKRITARAHNNEQSPLIEVSTFDYLIHREYDNENVLKSGRDWYMEMFRNSNSMAFNENIPDIDQTQLVKFKCRLAVRSLINSSLSVGLNGNDLINKQFYRVSGEYDKDYMTTPEVLEGSFTVNGPAVNIQFNYSKPASNSYVYLDYYSLRASAKLKWNGSTSFFNKSGTELNGYIKYKIEGNTPLIFDITDKLNPILQEKELINGNSHFTVNAEKTLKKFVMFDPGAVLSKPIWAGVVQNQNLHNLRDIEYIIVANHQFVEQAKRLAEFHHSLEGYTYAVVTPEQVYNEFSSGAQDITAIRDFAKMMYDRSSTSVKKFKFLLLFGDASFDFKERVKNNTNLVPTFESYNSHQPAYSYSSDDYYAILDDEEGYWGVNLAKEGLDIGIGRIPASNEYEAKTMVDKIIRYHTKEALGDWRNQVTFLGDDEDSNTHFNDVESVTQYIYTQAPVFNVNKIYLDAFKQEVFGSGQKYPGVNVAIDQSFDRGHLIFNYLGHGGQSGMAHERVVTRDQISNWTNANKLPLLVTATCELSRFDDPAQASPGELMLFNEHGGGIGLITTSRLVYIGLNKDLNVAVFNQNIFNKVDNKWQTLGEIYKNAKNNSARAENQRNFILLGDPAMTLSYPEKSVVATKINKAAVGTEEDTLKALSSVNIEGEIQNTDGSLLSDFNGTVYPTVYDKFLTYSTLGNDVASYPAEYLLQNSVLYRGKVSVENGKFSFSFVVPKDIAYQYGQGKISFYASNDEIDANGYNNQFYIGGTESTTKLDTTGPELKLFMEDESFRLGDMVSANPLMLAKVYDINGINTVGNGIGRDITAILDKGMSGERLYILNDYYQSKLDSYQEGEIRFPFETLPEGRHTLHLKLWDVYNNSASAYTEFVIGKNNQLVLNSFYTYPNPTNGPVTFVFNHNKPEENLHVKLEISSVIGDIVYSESFRFDNATARVEISENTEKQILSGLAKGMYIARLRVSSSNGDEASAFQKIILR